ESSASSSGSTLEKASACGGRTTSTGFGSAGGGGMPSRGSDGAGASTTGSARGGIGSGAGAGAAAGGSGSGESTGVTTHPPARLAEINAMHVDAIDSVRLKTMIPPPPSEPLSLPDAGARRRCRRSQTPTAAEAVPDTAASGIRNQTASRGIDPAARKIRVLAASDVGDGLTRRQNGSYASPGQFHLNRFCHYYWHGALARRDDRMPCGGYQRDRGDGVALQLIKERLRGAMPKAAGIAVAAAALAAGGISAVAQEGHPIKGSWLGTWESNDVHGEFVLVVMDWDGEKISGIINPGTDNIEITNATLNPDGWIVQIAAT